MVLRAPRKLNLCLHQEGRQGADQQAPTLKLVAVSCHKSFPLAQGANPNVARTYDPTVSDPGRLPWSYSCPPYSQV